MPLTFGLWCGTGASTHKYIQGVEFGFEMFKGDAERRMELATLKAEEDALNAEVIDLSILRDQYHIIHEVRYANPSCNRCQDPVAGNLLARCCETPRLRYK